MKILITFVLFAGVAFAQTTVVLNGATYTLQSHPRVMLDGAKGALATALQNTGDRANNSNPAYQALITQANNYVAGGYRHPMTDYFSWDDADNTSNDSPSTNTLIVALAWWAQGGPSQSPIDPHGYLAAAEYGVENGLRVIGNSAACPTGTILCSPLAGGARDNDTDYTRQNMFDLAQAYSIIRSQLTPGQRQNFANMILNDWTASQGGIDTVACTPQTVSTGTGTLSTTGLNATVTITGGTTAQLALGSVLFNNPNAGNLNGLSYGSSPAAVVTAITNSSTFTVSPAINAGSSYSLIYSPPWTTGNCGVVWFIKHHTASPPIAANYVGNYGSGGTGVGPDSNLNFTALYGEIAMGLALADDDPRAVTLLEQAYNWWFANQYGYYLSADTGFGSSGNAYSNARTHLFKQVLAQEMNASVISGLNLGGSWLSREVPFEFMMFLPDYPEDVMTFEQPAANKWGSGSGAISTLYTMSYVQGADPNAPYLNYYLRTTRNDYTAGFLESTSTSYPVTRAYIFMDPAAAQTNISGAPTQYLFNDTEYSTCTRLSGVTCYPNTAYAQVVTRSGWTATDDVAMLETGWTNGSDHSSGSTGTGGDWGDFRIYRNSAYLLADDTGWQSDMNGTPEQMNSIELGGGANWAYGDGYETWPVDVYCNGAGGGNGSKSYAGTWGGCNAPILRWASTDPTGDSSNRYMYVMTDMKNVYNPNNITTAPIRVQRHIMHFKKPAYQDYFVVYDDVAPGAATTIAALWQYGLCPWAAANDSAINPATCLSPSSAISFSGNTVSDTQANSRLNSTFIYPGAPGTLINQGNTYTGHNGLTNRLYSCQGTSGTCNTSATSFEEIVVHQPINGTSGTMPAITSPACTGAVGNCAVTQIADSGYPRVAMFARQGALLTGASFTTTHSGTAQYLIAGLSPGTYQVVLNGSTILSNQTVASGDNTLYFESSSGSIAVTQTAAAPGNPILSCDLNGNGAVNVQDVQISVNAVLGLVPCLPQYQLDGSGTCTVIDVQRVANAVLGLGCVIGQ